MKISTIVAMGKNRVIGKSNQMMWHIPSEHKHYRDLLADHLFIMGRKNYEGSLGKFEKNRSIVLTRNTDYSCDSPVFSNVEEAIAYAKAQGEQELFIMGGAEIYRLLMPYIDTLYLSVVDFELEGDSYFPDHEVYDWKTIKHHKHEISEDTPLAWEFFELQRVK